MNSISTRIIIRAHIEKVWDVFTDYDSFDEWNPLIKSFEGSPAVGQKIKVVLQLPNSKPMTFKPAIQVYKISEEISMVGQFNDTGAF